MVVFNGEIYNYEKLKQELENKHGCVFRTSSDTEIITVGFPIWRTELFKRLEGMFTVHFGTRKNEQLYLTRDSLGIKPLYLYEDKVKTFFASEIKAFQDIDIKLNPASIHTYLAAGYPGPSSTLIERVRQLDPGSIEGFYEARQK